VIPALVGAAVVLRALGTHPGRRDAGAAGERLDDPDTTDR
jgi:hypothetical protein